MPRFLIECPLYDDNEEESTGCHTNSTSELRALLQTNGGALPEIAPGLGIAASTLGKLIEVQKEGGSTLPGSELMHENGFKATQKHRSKDVMEFERNRPVALYLHERRIIG